MKAKLDELVLRADQIQCRIHALATLLDKVQHVHNLIRAVGHEGSLGEYLDLVMDLLHLDSPAHGMVYEPIPTAPRLKIRVLPPQPVASSSKKRTRDNDNIPDLSPNKTFDAYLKSHTGIASTLEKKVGSERIVFAGGCEWCRRMGLCFTTLSASSSDKGAQGRSCLSCVMAKKSCRHGKFYIYPETEDFIRFWNDQRADPVDNADHEPAPKHRKEKPEAVKEEPAPDRKGKGKARELAPVMVEEPGPADSLMTQPVPDILPNASYGSVPWEPALTYGLDALTPLPGDHLDRIPSSSRRGRTMKFGFPPEECSDEERARRYAACTAAMMQYFTYMHRSNAQLAGRKFILRLVENLHPLRYRPPLSIGPTPSLHSDTYPVPVPELCGNVQWRALLHAYANELPILMYHAWSKLVEDDLERLRHGEFYEPDFSELEGFRAVDAYWWITRDSISLEVLARLEDKSLFLPTDEPASPVRTPPPLDLPSLSSAIQSSRPLVNDVRARMNLAPNTDPMPLLSPQHDIDTSMPAPLSLVGDCAASEVGGSTRQPSVARSEAGDIIVNTGGRDESLSCALDSGLGELGGAPAAEDISIDVDKRGRSDAETLRLGAIDSREGSFDVLEQEREGSRKGTVGAETAGEKVDSREGSVRAETAGEKVGSCEGSVGAGVVSAS
ncbi:hypothetical protein B0H13DRAFT_2338616 [Mycena leptocephala]|nr:hypothetical protein B0H13DRAFT_2338616 [Mycena leptocephala]